jgi:hypothetical protein
MSSTTTATTSVMSSTATTFVISTNHQRYPLCNCLPHPRYHL